MSLYFSLVHKKIITKTKALLFYTGILRVTILTTVDLQR